MINFKVLMYVSLYEDQLTLHAWEAGKMPKESKELVVQIKLTEEQSRKLEGSGMLLHKGNGRQIVYMYPMDDDDMLLKLK